MSKENRTIPYQTECPKNAWVKTVSGGLDLAREEFPATPGMQTKPDARTVHKSNRKYAQCDIFGGHGIYYHLWPIGYSMALFGILPVSFNPVRISFNPVRSTLAYCVLVTAAVLWSARCMLLDRSAVLLDPQASLQARFNSVLCCIHASGLLMVPLLWLEASNTHNNEHICASLMQTLPPGALGKCRFSVCVSWMAAIFSAVFSPLLTLLYLRVIATEGGAYTHVLIHNHVMLLLFLICLLFSTQPHCVKNVANTLRACVVKASATPCSTIESCAPNRQT